MFYHFFQKNNHSLFIHLCIHKFHIFKMAPMLLYISCLVQYVGQVVTLLNPKNPRHKVASGKISGLWGLDKFHGCTILDFWFKVYVDVVHMPEVPLIHPHDANDQYVVEHVEGACTLWNWKFVKLVGWWNNVFEHVLANLTMFCFWGKWSNNGIQLLLFLPTLKCIECF